MEMILITVSNYTEAVRVPKDTQDLKCVGIDDDVLSIIIQRTPILRRIDVSGCDQITDESVTKLATLPTLEEVDLSLCNQVTDASCDSLATLQRLNFLSLGWCYSISDSALESLQKCVELEALLLWGCERITDRGVISISDLPKLKRLELPELSAISDAAIIALASGTPQLSELRLTSLEQLSGRGLMSLQNKKSLEILFVHGCANVSKEAVAELGKALPSCLIDFQP